MPENRVFVLTTAADMLWAHVDPPKACAIIEPVIDRANDEISKLMLLDKVVKSGIIKKGEIIMRQSGAIPLDFAVFKYGKGVSALANADFNRRKALTDRLQRNELRIIARLLIAQSILRSLETVATNTQQ